MGIDYFSKLQSKLDTTTTKGGYFSSIDPKNNVKDTGSQRPVNSFVANGNEVADSQDYNKPETTVAKRVDTPKTYSSVKTPTQPQAAATESKFDKSFLPNAIANAQAEADAKKEGQIVQGSSSFASKLFNKPKLGDSLVDSNTTKKYTDYLNKGKLPSAVASGMTRFVRGTNEFASMILDNLKYTTDAPIQSGGQYNLSKMTSTSKKETGLSKIIPTSIKEATEDFYEASDKTLREIADKYTENYMNDSSTFETYAYQAVDAFVQMIPTITTSLATGGVGLAAKLTGMAPFFASAAGNYKFEAVEKGIADPNSYGLAAGMLETIPEMLSLGVAMKFLKGTAAKVTGKAITEAAAKTVLKVGAKNLIKSSAQSVGKYGLTILKAVGAEGLEEVAINPALKGLESGLTGKKFKTFGEGGVFDPVEAKESFIGGGSMALIFAALGLPSFASSLISTTTSQSLINKTEKLIEAKKVMDKYLVTEEGQVKLASVISEGEGEVDTEQAPVQDTDQVVDVNKKVDLVSAEIAQTETGTETSPVVAKTAPTQTGDGTAQAETGVKEISSDVLSKEEVSAINKDISNISDFIVEEDFSTNDYASDYVANNSKLEERYFKDNPNVESSQGLINEIVKIAEANPVYAERVTTESASTAQTAQTVAKPIAKPIVSEPTTDYTPTTQEIAKVEQSVKDLTLALEASKDPTMTVKDPLMSLYGGLIDKSATKFLDAKLKKHQKLLQELLAKKVTRTTIDEVKKLMQSKNSIADMKKEFAKEKVALRKELKVEFDKTLKEARTTLKQDFVKEKEAIQYLDENKKQDAIDKLNRKYWDKIDSLQKKLDDEKYKALWNKEINKQQIKQRMDTLRNEVKYEIAEMKQKQKQKEADIKERARMTKKTTKLKDAATDLKKNSKQMYPHYKAAAEEILDLLDVKAKSISTKKLMSLTKSQEFFAKEKKSDPSYEIPERMKAGLERLGKQSISSMTEEDIDILQTTIDHITNQNETKGILIAGQNKRRVDKVIASMQESLDKAQKLIDGDTKLKKNEKSLIQYFIKTSALSPENMALKLSGFDANSSSFEVLYTNLTAGQLIMTRFELDAQRGFKEAEETLDISTHREEVSLANTTLKMTGWEKISLYLHTQNADNILHLKNGGIRFDKYAKVYELTQADVDSVKGTLSEDELAYAKLVQNYFKTTSKDALNEVSVKLLGCEIATIENYFPIVNDSLYKQKDFNKQFQKLLIEQQSFLRQRTHGDNTIRLEDVRKVKNRSISGTGKYYGMAIPLRDAKMLLGDEGIKKSIINKFGTSQQKYYDKLWSDIEGYTSEVDPAESGLITVQKNLQQAIIGLNPGILLNQLASFPTAFAELNPLDLISTNGLKPNISFDLMKKYSPIIEYRMQGHVTRETGEAMLSEHMRWTTKGVTFFDSIAIAKIWNVVEAEIKRTNPDIKYKSDEYYEKVARRTEEVIYRTQPNYTLMQRSAIQRSNNFIARTLSFFSTQRNQNYNILYRSLMTYNKTPVESTKAILSVATGTLVVALVRSLRHKWRKEEDSVFDNYISSLLGNVYLLGSLYDLYTKNYSIENPSLQSLNELGAFIISAGKSGSETSAAGHAVKILGSLAQLAGIPLKNFLKEFGTIIQHTNTELYDIWTEFQTKAGSVGTLNTRIRVIEKEIEEGNYTNSEDLELYKEFKKAITDLESEYKKEIETPYDEAGVEIPKATIKAYEDYYKEIAKSALGR